MIKTTFQPKLPDSFKVMLGLILIVLICMGKSTRIRRVRVCVVFWVVFFFFVLFGYFWETLFQAISFPIRSHIIFLYKIQTFSDLPTTFHFFKPLYLSFWPRFVKTCLLCLRTTKVLTRVDLHLCSPISAFVIHLLENTTSKITPS